MHVSIGRHTILHSLNAISDGCSTGAPWNGLDTVPMLETTKIGEDKSVWLAGWLHWFNPNLPIIWHRSGMNFIPHTTQDSCFRNHMEPGNMVQSKVEGPFKDGPALYLGVHCSIRRGPQTLQAIHQSVHIYGGEIMGSHVLSTSGTINMSSARRLYGGSRLGLCDHI